MHWYNFTYEVTCGIAEMTFNALSLKWVHQTRKQAHTVSTAENRKKHIKLLIQSGIIGLVFASAGFSFTFITFQHDVSPMACLVMQCIWTINHCNNPIVYLCVNSRLRKAFLKFVSCGYCAKSNQVSIDCNRVVQVGEVGRLPG